MGIKNFDPQDLYRTDANIRLGCWYLGELEYEFQRNWVLMMIAYNAGRGNTKAWMQENNWDYDFNKIEDIPYSDTREYVKKVLYDRDEYYKLYKNRLKSIDGIVIVCYYITVADLGNCNAVVAERQTR